MRIATANRKGGTGKTSTAGNLAYELSRDHSVLMIDCDPQGSLSSWLWDGKERKHELADVLFRRCEPREAIGEVYPQLNLMPTFMDGDLKVWAENQAGREPFTFLELCKDLEDMGYRFLVVDLPPSFGTFEEAILSAMDRALMVLDPEFLAFDGLAGLIRDLEDAKRRRHSLVRYDWLVANKINASFRRHRAYLEAYGRAWEQYRIYQVPQSSKVPEAQTYHQPLALYEPSEDRALPKYRELAMAIKEDR